MNFNKYTKAELISELKNIPSEMKNIPQNKENKSKGINANKIEHSVTIWDILNKLKIFILTLPFIIILSRIFKNYKSIRAILRLANYVILTLFGFSMYEIFGFGFFTQFKYFYDGIVSYLSESKFHLFLKRIFNVTEEVNKESIRNTYKKKQDAPWSKEDFIKKQMEMENKEWYKRLEERERERESNDNYNTNRNRIFLILTVLMLFGAAYYYSDSIGPAAGGISSLFNTLKNLIRGNNVNNDEDISDVASITFENKMKKANIKDDDNVSEGILEYATDSIQKSSSSDTIKASSSNIPEAPPAPPAPPIPKTEQGQPTISINTSEETPRVGPHIEPVGPGGLFEAIRGGKNLKKTKTVVKDRLKTGKVIGDDSVDDNIQPIDNSLTGILSQGLDKLRKVIDKNDDDIYPMEDNWEDQPTPTQSTIITSKIDKGKQKAKFLDAIDIDKSRSAPVSPVSESGSVSSTKANLGISNDSKIAPVLQQIKDNFPNLSNETLEKLSTPEGLKNREAIINSLPDDEILTFSELKKNHEKESEDILKDFKGSDSAYVIDKLVQTFPNMSDETLMKLSTPESLNNREAIINSLSEHELFSYADLEKIHKKEIEDIVKDSIDLDSEDVISKLNEKFPGYKINEEGYRESFIRAVESVISEGKTEEEQNKIRNDFLQTDLKELKNMNNSDIRSIKNVIRENYTHNSLLNEIKRKKSSISTPIENQPESSYYKNNADTDKMDNTMNLFD